MKRSFFLLIVIFVCFTEDNFAQKFKGILFIGLNSSQFDGDAYTGYKKPGLISGAGVNYPLTENWLLQTEFYYTRKGSREINETTFFILKLNYLEIPFLIIYRTGAFGFQSGIGYGVLISSMKEDKYGSSEIECIGKYDLSGSAGFSYSFTEHLGFDFRFSYSLMNVLQGCTIWYGGPVRGYNNLLSSTVRYKF